jgi:hypothetical protein
MGVSGLVVSDRWRLGEQAEPGREMERFVDGRCQHWSSQASQGGGVTGTQTTTVEGQRSKTSPILGTAFEAILGVAQYQDRDATDVVTGKVTSNQAGPNMGLGVPIGATFTAEWTWKFTPARGPAGSAPSSTTPGRPPASSGH